MKKSGNGAAVAGNSIEMDVYDTEEGNTIHY